MDDVVTRQLIRSVIGKLITVVLTSTGVAMSVEDQSAAAAGLTAIVVTAWLCWDTRRSRRARLALRGQGASDGGGGGEH